MKRLLVLVALIGCGDDDDGPTCTLDGGKCSEDMTALYARGCTIHLPSGVAVPEADLRAMCPDQIACGGDGCDARIRDFDACLGGAGLTVVCQ